jgi:hypothetical protein
VTETVGCSVSLPIMNIIEEHRTEFRVGIHTYCVEITALPSGDESTSVPRVAVLVGAAGPQGEPVGEGRIEVDAGVAVTLASVLADSLRSSAGITGPGRRRPGDRPAQQGRPWSDELDAVGDPVAGRGTVEDIAARFERKPGGTRVRLPRVGRDPEKQGAYLPLPPSRRPGAQAGDVG